MRARFLHSLLLIVLIATGSCDVGRQSSSIKGDVRIAIDESVARSIDSVLRRYAELYKDARVTTTITSAREAIVMLAERKIDLVFLGREMTQDESNAFEQREETHLTKNKIAHHAIGIVVQSSNPVRTLSREQLQRILRGEIRSWDNLGGAKQPIRVLMTNNNSMAYQVLAKQNYFDSLRCDYRFVSRSSEIDSLVAATPGALGVLPMAWVPSDTNRIRALDLLNTIADDPQHKEYPISLHLANVYRERYPIRSTIFAYRYDAGVDVALGVVSFYCSAAGQKLLLQCGLVPATMPVRLVQFGEQS